MSNKINTIGTQPYPAWIEIDLDAVTHNLRLIQERVGRETLLYPVIKSNAYGHGLVPVAKTAVEVGAGGVCVARIWEARELRQAGFTAPIIVLVSILPDEAEEAVALDIEPVMFRREPAEALDHAARAAGRTINVHFKVDTGMGRLGISPEDAVEYAQFLASLRNLKTRGLMSHLSNADDEDPEMTLQQIRLYNEIGNRLKENGVLPPVGHIGNSDGTMRFEGAGQQICRPGVITYGCYSSDWVEENYQLQPAKSVRARLISVRRIPAGRGLSYSREFVTKRDSLIGVCPIGYADGYLRAMKTKAQMIVGGHRVPVLGRICMEQTILDLTDLPEPPQYGDVVTALGFHGNEHISAEEMGGWAGTINYEVLCHFGRQFPRFFQKNGDLKEG